MTLYDDAVATADEHWWIIIIIIHNYHDLEIYTGSSLATDP